MTFSTRRIAALGLAAGLSACSTTTKDGATDDTDMGGDTDTNTTCTAAIKPVLPLNNATDVDYRAPFVVGFSADEHTTGSFTLAKASDGSSVALGSVTWSTDGKQASFAASAPLAPSTQYKLSITFSCSNGTPTDLTFTTTSTGTPVSNNELILGNTYAIDLATATIIEPAGVNSLLGSLIGSLSQTIAVVPTEVDGDGKLHFYGGILDGGAQDVCQETIVFPEGATFTDPYFEISEPNGLPLTFSGITINLLALQLSGSFAPDASSIQGLTLDGQIDTRDLIDVLGSTLGGDTSDGAVCNLLGTFTNNAVKCAACPADAPNGAGDFCLTLVAANIVADESTTDLQLITADDVANNADCNTAASN